MAISGKLNLIETLLALEETGRSGVVRFELGKAKKQLVLQGGKVAAAESNVPDEHLARVLLQMNRLARNDLAAITALMRSGKASDEAVLASGKVDPEGIAEAAREQAIMIFASLFGWSDCESRFYAGDGLVRRGVNLQMPIPELVVLGGRRAVSKRQLPHSFPKLSGIVSRAESTRVDPLRLPLDGVEAMVYAETGQPQPVASVLALVPAGTTPAEEILLRLLVLGLLRIEAAKPVESPREEAERGAEMLLKIEEMLHRFEVAGHYEILGIPVEATQDQVQVAYHELAMEFHPDRFQSREHSADLRAAAEKLFTYITGAYTSLGDPTLRAMYDETRAKEGQVEAAVRARAGADVDKEKMAETLYASGRARLIERNYETAAAHLKEAVYLQPDVARYQHLLGVAQAEVPRLRKEAEQHLLKALQLNQMAVESYLALGKLYLKVNLPRRAELQFQEALRWDANNGEARRLLESLSKGEERGGILGKVKRPFSR